MSRWDRIKARARWRLIAATIAGALLVGGANSWVLYGGRASLSLAHQDDGPRPVAIVPGTAASQGRPLSLLTARLRAALELYRAGRVSGILISGVDSPEDPEVHAMRAWLAERGVPSADVMVDGGGTRTRATMERAANVFRVKRAIVCTQDVSLPRALFLARQAGIEAEGAAIPSPLSRSLRWLGTEAAKNTIAFVESYWPASRDPATTTLAAL
jgi:vancomycin permeability regulator SanA